MDYHKNNQTDPWDEGVYGIGNTSPPKSHSGIIALLLILVIFLSGIISVLSFLNIRLFQQLTVQQEKQENAMPMSFSDLAQDISETKPEIPDTVRPVQSDISIRLNKSPQSVENVPQKGALSLQEIYEKNISGVVSVLSTTPTGNLTGSGVVISREGYIITTCQTVSDGETITVTLHDGQSFSAIVIGADSMTDLAVLYVNAAELTAVEFGDSASLRVGDSVAAIGDPLGSDLGGSLTPGIISALHQDVLLSGQPFSLIQSSAPINSGNAGGPLLNCYGQVIGINTTNSILFSSREDIGGIGFAIPSATVKTVVEQLIAQGYVSGRPTLGLRGEEISRFDQSYFQIPPGLYITQVDPFSDACDQGIEPGDILISLDGQPVTTQTQLDAIVNSQVIGDTLTALFFRNGQEEALTLTITEYTG